MKQRRLLIPLLLALLLSAFYSVASAQDKSYSARTFDTNVVIEEGGSILVTETVTFDFVGGPFTFVFRELPVKYTDGITVLEASVDGRTYPRGDQAGQVEITGNSPIRVEWHFNESSNTTRVYELTYRVEGVIRAEDGNDVLYWQPLPDDFEYNIGSSTTSITYPSGLQLVRQPTIDAGTAFLNESGNVVRIDANNIEPNTVLIVQIDFEEGAFVSEPPEWQARQQRNLAQLPYWLAGAIGLIAVGAFALFRRFQAHFIRFTTKEIAQSPPDKLDPALAGVLALPGGTPNWNHAQSTLFSLAEQGVVVIEELDEKTWYRKHNFVVKQVDYAIRDADHENALLTLLFEDKKGVRTGSVRMSDIASKISGKRWETYKDAVTNTLNNAGLLSEERKRARIGMTVIGVVLFALGTIGTIVGGVVSYNIGFGPLSIAIVAAVLGILALILGSQIVPLSDLGVERLIAWQQSHNYLKKIATGKETNNNPALFEKYLPYATSIGVLRIWTKRFEKDGYSQPPAYFRALPSTDSSHVWGSYVAMNSTIGASGGSSSGGGGGGGAAGGGGSGAG